MMNMKKEILRDYRFWLIVICALVYLVLGAFDLLKFSLPVPSDYGAANCAFVYIASALPFFIVFAVAAFRTGKSKRLIYIGLLLVLSYAVRILLVNFESRDYSNYLHLWVEEYKSLSIRECFKRQVGNYAPLYNYFLIAFSRIGLKDMYLIKMLSFYGEVITAVFAVKLIAFVRKGEFDFLWLAILLLVPIFICDSVQWGQCDTLYTLCAVAGVYFALKRKSVPCYIFMGIGLAFKMQILVIVPVGLILLLAKNPDGGRYIRWRYLCIFPLVFMALSSVPVFFGGSFFKVFKVYFEQTVEGNGTGLNLHCANILLMFTRIPKGTAIYYVLLVAFILIAFAANIFIIVFSLKASGRVLDEEKLIFLCVAGSFVSVYFMPKMLDRFFYIPEMFLFIYFAIKRDKNSFTTFALLETAQWLMFSFVLWHVAGVYNASPVFSTLALLLIIARFFTYFPSERMNKFSIALER